MSRVLLVYHHALFALSIHAALLTEPCIQLVGELKDWTCVEAEIERLAPDVILVEEDEATATDTMLKSLRAHQKRWRVVAMRMDDTTIHIWSGAGKELQKPQDLFSALRAVPGQRQINPRATQLTTPGLGDQ